MTKIKEELRDIYWKAVNHPDRLKEALAAWNDTVLPEIQMAAAGGDHRAEISFIHRPHKLPAILRDHGLFGVWKGSVLVVWGWGWASRTLQKDGTAMTWYHIIPWALFSIFIVSLCRYRHRRFQEALGTLANGWLQDAEWYRKRTDVDGKPVARCLEMNARDLNKIRDKWP